MAGSVVMVEGGEEVAPCAGGHVSHACFVRCTQWAARLRARCTRVRSTPALHGCPMHTQARVLHADAVGPHAYAARADTLDVLPTRTTKAEVLHTPHANLCCAHTHPTNVLHACT